MYTLFYSTANFSYVQDFETLEEINFQRYIDSPVIKYGAKVVDSDGKTVLYKHESDYYELTLLKEEFNTENLLIIRKGIFKKIDFCDNIINKTRDQIEGESALKNKKDWQKDLEILEKIFIFDN